jgi:hypothetical protein
LIQKPSKGANLQHSEPTVPFIEKVAITCQEKSLSAVDLSVVAPNLHEFDANPLERLIAIEPHSRVKHGTWELPVM